MDTNTVQLSGIVKRDAEFGTAKGEKILDFALVTEMEDGYKSIFDCRVLERSMAFAELDGYVDEGEYLTVTGHLKKLTSSKEGKIAGVTVSVKVTDTIIVVDEVERED